MTSCFWCKSDKHNALRCKKRPKLMLEAFERGKLQGAKDERKKIAKKICCAASRIDCSSRDLCQNCKWIKRVGKARVIPDDK